MAIELKTQNGESSALLDVMRALADRKERPTPWVDAQSFPWRDDDFSARYVRRANYQELGMQETGEEVDALATLLGTRPKARVLDLCSGNGRHAIAMALRGCRVTGIDIGPGAVHLARETAGNLGLPVDFRLLDVRNVSFEDAYDCAYLTCGGISSFSPTDAADVLAIVERALVPGGTVVVEYATSGDAPAESRSWQYIQAERSLFADGPHLQLEERMFDADAAAEVARYFVVPSEGPVREYAQCRQFYAEGQVRELLRAARLEPLTTAPGSARGFAKISAKKA